MAFVWGVNLLNYKLFIEGYVESHAADPQDILNTLVKYNLSFHYSGNFTTAVLYGPRGHTLVGNSKRNKLDSQNPTKGRAVALCRVLDLFIVNWYGDLQIKDTGSANIGPLDELLGIN